LTAQELLPVGSCLQMMHLCRGTEVRLTSACRWH